MELNDVKNIVIVVEGGLVRNVMTNDPGLKLRLTVLGHDVEEFTGHIFEGKNVIFYEENLQVDPDEVQRIFNDAGPSHMDRR